MSNLNINNDINSNRLGFNSSSNYYEQKVKEGIPIFQEMNGSGTLRNNYVDPFKLLENGKNYNFSSLREMGGGNDLFGSNVNITDIETKRIFEREMNPYLAQMKKELNLIIEKFRNELEQKSNLFNEISLIKELTLKNKSNDEMNFSNLENKILNLKDSIVSQNNRIKFFENNLIDINNKNKIFNERMDDYENQMHNLEKISNLYSSNENVEKGINDRIETMINLKLDQIFKKIDLINQDNLLNKKELANNENKIKMLNMDNDERNLRLNDIDNYFNKIQNQMNMINLNNNKNLNLFNKFEAKNKEFQQHFNSIEEKILKLNDNLNNTSVDIRAQKDLINSNRQKLLNIDNSISFVKNENSMLDTKITDLDLKLKSQEGKIDKNKSELNDTFSRINNNYYKDLITKINKSKDLLEDMTNNYDMEISKLKEEIDLIKKNNPFLNGNENERLSFLFKKHQIESNEIFKKQIDMLIKDNEILKKMNSTDNFKKIEKNFKNISVELNKEAAAIKLLDETTKSRAELSEQKEREKEKKILDMENTIKTISGIVETLSKNSGKYQNKNATNINSNFNESNLVYDQKLKTIQSNVNDLSLSIKSIINDKIPEIYKYIDNKTKIQLIKSNEIKNNNNPIKINDGSDYFSNKKTNNVINEDFNFNNKINFNINNNNNNNNKIYTNMNENNNFNNNKNSFENNNNNNNININSKNIDDIADQIEMMGSVKNVNKVFNNNNLNIDDDQNKNIKDFNVSSFSHKEDDFESNFDE